MNTIDKIIIRTDATLKIGSGHVMRCLTLAEELRDSRAEVRFVCRGYSGNLIELIREKGFFVHELSVSEDFEPGGTSNSNSRSEYGSRLGSFREQDAWETINVIQKNLPDWLIVDHYGLGQAWEKRLRPHVHKIMVIDDLADRPHDCDLLLDQNYFQDGATRYNGLVPPTCTKLLGPQFALLRPEFAEARKQLKPRTGKVKRIFVFFGGTDPDNVTGKTLEALLYPEFSHLDVDVVIGSHNPHRIKIENQIKTHLRTNLHVQVENIAELMAQADLAIGAGGATTWERLCLGLPSLVVMVAENQRPYTEYLHQDKYLNCLGKKDSLSVEKIQIELKQSLGNSKANKLQSQKGIAIVNGNGVSQVVEMINKIHHLNE